MRKIRFARWPEFRCDRNAPPRSIERMAAELNVASLEIFPGAGHLGWIPHEERMLRELLY